MKGMCWLVENDAVSYTGLIRDSVSKQVIIYHSDDKGEGTEIKIDLIRTNCWLAENDGVSYIELIRGGVRKKCHLWNFEMHYFVSLTIIGLTTEHATIICLTQ